MTNFLITGANSDIGVACIQKIVASGGSVIAVHRTLGSKLISICRKYPSKIELVKLDFSDDSQVNSLLDLVEEKKTQTDSFIALAALREEIPYGKTSREDLMKHFEVNVVPTVFIVQKLGESMSQKGWGRIVIGSSIGVKFGGGINTFSYSLSKHLNEFMPSEIKKLSSKNILYNTVRIGVTDTKFHKKIKNKSIQKRIKLIPLKKMATTKDIAKYIFYLIVENNFITNEIINITGGE